MNKHSSAAALDALWDSAPVSKKVFDPARLNPLSVPRAARRFLEHAIAAGTPLACGVRLRMHGEFRRKEWYPFTAEQVIRTDGEMLWCATLRIHGLPVTGFDRILDGKGMMAWKMLGFLPLASATGSEITRSTLGRIAGESIWLPSLLCSRVVSWTSADASHAHAHVTLLGEGTRLALSLTDTGGLTDIRYMRWGDPDGGGFHFTPFGGVVEAERSFGGYTIPTRLRVGWYFGTPRFDSEGEFLRVTIDDATFR